MKMIAIALAGILFSSCYVFTKTFEFNKVDFAQSKMIFESENKSSTVRIELGKKLFFDPIFSIDSSISCASCHKPQFAFSDTVKFSDGVFGRAGTRNTPSLMNIGYHPYFLREGSVKTIEMQALVPIQEENEFDHNIVEIGNKLNKIPEYRELSKKAYDREPDYYVITRALGVYQRTLVSNNSKFDQFVRGEAKLSSREKKGKELFFGNANCSSCHSGFNFTNYALTNNGLYQEYKDIGRMRATKDSADLAVFKTPSLRNIELTGPYMHDGSFKTLKEVVEHYNNGGVNHPNKDSLIEPLNLNNGEIDNIVLFLKALTELDLKPIEP